jgi:hypothetical protein
MQFLDSIQGVMKDWSLNRAPDLLDKTGRLVQNPNLQIFSSKPSIIEADFLAAYKWNQMQKEIRFLKSAGLYFVKAHKPDDAQDLAISTDECKSYLNSVESSAFSLLSSLLSTVHGIHCMKMNMVDWELSTCTCTSWMKTYKCDHIIATAVRLSTGIGLLESHLSGLVPGAQKQARCKETIKASSS